MVHIVSLCGYKYYLQHVLEYIWPDSGARRKLIFHWEDVLAYTADNRQLGRRVFDCRLGTDGLDVEGEGEIGI